jgi:2'-hydroxyisoflavone reductase
MRILFIGGTRFVGLAIAQCAASRGHEVTIFNRGKTLAEIQGHVTYINGDRDSDLSGLKNGEWDVTIDVCGYRFVILRFYIILLSYHCSVDQGKFIILLMY